MAKARNLKSVFGLMALSNVRSLYRGADKS